MRARYWQIVLDAARDVDLFRPGGHTSKRTEITYQWLEERAGEEVRASSLTRPFNLKNNFILS